MKYLLSWVCRHLAIKQWLELGSIEEIVKKISLHTAEISSYKSISYDNLEFGIAKIINATDSLCIAQYNDQEKIINLPVGMPVQEGFSYVVILTEQKRYRFATMKDFHSEVKNHMLSPIYGEIKDNLEYLEKLRSHKDYILTIDSVAIGHRPDLFSHQGLARELSILFDKELILEKDLYYNMSFSNHHEEISKKKPMLLHNKAKQIESFAAVQIKLNETPSILEHLVLLSSVDITGHSFLVDTSNIVMLDIGQPLHVFDHEQITMLTFKDDVQGEFVGIDNTKIKISEDNIVLEDEEKNIVSLVGIMGGKSSEVSLTTKEVLIESACPKKEAIKKTIKLHGKKTESAIRMEKGTSPKAPQFAIRRFLEIVKKHQDITNFQFQFEYNAQTFELDPIIISEQYISNIIGTDIDKSFILNILEKTGCTITQNKEFFYVTVPWWRLDLQDSDNIVEEIARFFGYDNIPLAPPSIKAKITKRNYFIEDLKKQTVFLANAQEIFSYGIAHEEIKNAWQKEYGDEIRLKNPYNDRLKTLARGYLENLLEIANKELKTGTTGLKLFEINPIWKYNEDQISEEIIYTFLSFSQNRAEDFYYYRDLIKNIFITTGYELSFKQEDTGIRYFSSCYSGIKSNIYVNKILIGTCGFIDPLLVYKNTKSSSLFFGAEINLSLLLKEIKNKRGLEENFLSFDISCFIEKTEKTAKLEALLKISFGYIAAVKIVDWFESPEWKNMRSVTFRIYVFTQEINTVYKEVKEYLKERVCKIR